MPVGRECVSPRDINMNRPGFRRHVVALLVPALLALCGPIQAAVRIWAVDDGVRIDPRTGKAVEESAIYPERLRIKPGYRDRNWIFDGAIRQIALAGARNEVLAFQLQIESDTPLGNVSVAISDLRGPARFPAIQAVRLFKEWYVEVKQPSYGDASPVGFDSLGPGWYPDALIPLDAPVKPEFHMPFDLPDRTNAVPGQKVQAIWVDLYIPRDQAPGLYEGTIRVTAREKEAAVEESLSLRLEVYPFTLPDENHLGISLNDYGSISPRRMSNEKLWKFYQMCHAHRCVLDVLYNGPQASGTGDGLKLDWSKYDEAFGPLLDGSALTGQFGYWGPGEGVPVKRLYLPFETSGGWAWPLPANQMETEPYELAVKKALRDFERHFLEKGWSRTKLMMFYNRYDESGRVKEISYFARLLREAGLREPSRFLYRVDGGSPAVVRGVGLEHVGVWCVNGNVRYTHLDEQRQIVRHGGQIWIYSSNSAREPCMAAPYIDAEALALRTWGWIPWKYRESVTTMCEWGTFYHADGRRWRDPSLAAALGGKQVLNGDALLIYPGEFVGLDGPVPCIRLKALRRGSQDFEYMRLLSQRTGDPRAADEIVDGVLFRAMHEALKPGQDYWKPHERDSRSHDPEQWDKARRKLAARIVSAKKSLPPFWKSRLSDVDAAVKDVKKGRVEVLAQSAGGRNIYLVTYGPKQPWKSSANYNSAVAGLDPASYARKDGTQRPVVLLLGPVHGSEVEGIVGLVNLLHVAETGQDLRGRPWKELSENLARCRVLIVPCANPDGRARCPFDSWVGEELSTHERVTMGTRPDGTNYQWPSVKRIHPMRGAAVGQLGAYFNDQGVNLMHDEWFDPMARETRAWLRLAREEAPDFIVSLHSHASDPSVEPTAYVPRTIKETIKQFGDRLQKRYAEAGLPHRSGGPEPKEDGGTFPPPSLNLTSALGHACGAVSFVFECPIGVKTKPYAALDYEQILDLQLMMSDELLKYAVAHPVKWTR